MVCSGVEEEVRQWFALVKCASLELPGRWFGRPFDNLHRLSWSEMRGEKLLLEFDDRLHLLVSGIMTVEVTPEMVTLDADHLVFDWQDSGLSGKHHTEVYDGGGCLRLHAGLSD